MKRLNRVEISELFFFHIVNHDTVFDRVGGKCMYHCFSEEGGGVRMVYKCNISKIKGQFLRNDFVNEVKGSASSCSPFASLL